MPDAAVSESLVGVELDNGDVLLRFVQTGAETGGTLHAQEARYRRARGRRGSPRRSGTCR